LSLKKIPEIDTDVLRFAFGDLLYNMSDRDKSDLRKKLVSEGKNIGARKLRMAINAELGSDPEKKNKLRKMYVCEGSYPHRMIGMVLMLTFPAVAVVAKAYFANAQDYYTVGQIADISNMVDQRGNISQAILRFRKHRRGIIRFSDNSGLALTVNEIGGRAGTAYGFSNFGPADEECEKPDLVFVVQPGQMPLLKGNVKDVYDQIAFHRNRGAKTIYHRLLRQESIAIYKIKGGVGRWTEIEITPEVARVRHVDAPTNSK